MRVADSYDGLLAVNVWRDRPRPAVAARPEPLPDGALLAGAVATRQAVRDFGPASLDPPCLIEIGAAVRAGARTVTADVADLLRVDVICQRVTGTEPGLYHLGATGLSGPVPLRGRPGQVSNQPQFRRAPALLVIGGDVATAEERIGAAAYLRLLMAAGAGGHAGWLRAVAAGLGGCLFNAIQPDCLPVGWGDRWNRHHLLALALGWPADA
jgi:hypothetical protein